MDLCASEGPKTVSSGKSEPHHVDLTIPNSAAAEVEVPTVRLSNQTGPDYPRHLCLPQLLEDSFVRNPRATAVECLGKSLTYAELDARSNQIARLLVRKGAGPDVLVGLCVERSIEMVAALLGILKAGAAYVPLDPSYPSDRIKYVLDDARVKILVTQAALSGRLPSTCAEIVTIDPEWQEFQSEDPGPVATGIDPDNLAYVIYTSGSTGRPKGVQLEHRSVVNFLCSMRRVPGMTADDVLVAVTTLSFDIAALEIYLPLLAGGKLVMASREVTMDGRLLMQLLKQSRATIMQATPTTWRVLLESGWEGDSKLKVLVGGEALPVDLARQLSRCCSSVWNMYGPTETTIWSSVYKIQGAEAKLVPIGKPIANTTFYILDENRQKVPEGAEGELYIGGEGLARGYFEREELTAEKFVPDPFSSIPAARMYRTGDLARYKPDGNVEFLGRIDYQVKVRGFRIELGEIEAVLEQYNGLNQAVVIAREDTPGDKRLVAYVVPSALNSVKSAALREHAQQLLPDYMIPSAFVQMPRLPLTPNGKVDRKSLPAPNASDFEIASDYVAPRDETERRLVTLWEDVLGISPVSVTASFFDLGGRSVLAARLFTKILRTFGKELPLSTLFQSPTVELLAKELQPARRNAEYKTIVPIQEGGSLPPFFCVHGGAGSTLFLHQLANQLGSAQPFYGVEPEGMDGKPFQRPTVEEMAGHYLSEIRKVQPNGPYYLGGYCFGGLVAFEMARMLDEQGEYVALVALFSAALRFNHAVAPPVAMQSSNRGGSRIARAVSSPIATLRNLSRAAYWRALPTIRKYSYQLLFSFGFRVPPDMRAMYVTRSLGQAEQSYKPKPYTGSLVLFYGPGTFDFGPNLGWDGLAERFEHCVIGDGILDSRRDIMNEPLVAITATRLALYLKRERGVHRLSPPLTAN
jgi:amino acid adenylation domain-containing protein